VNRIIGATPLLLLTLIAVACAPPAVPPETIAGTYTVTLTKDGLLDAGAGPVATALDGSEWIWEISSDGLYKVSEVTDIGVRPRSEGAFELTADRFVLLEDAGEMTCSEGGVDRGTYSWELSGEQLTFALVEDECQDRVYIMTAMPWVRTP
jgi:hypothetical protein